MSEKETTAIATPINWAEEFAKYSKAAMEAEKPDNKFVSFRAGVLAFNGQAAQGNKIEVIVVGSAFENAYYPFDFDSDAPRSPECWAIALTEDELAPDPDKVTEAESDTCKDCPQNEWGSDPKGRKGKACKNSRRLALVFDTEGVTAGDAFYARLPVTSVANWSKYVTQIGNVVKRPPWGVKTEISVVPDQKSQFKVEFKFVGLVPDERLEAIKEIHDTMTEGGQVLFGYPKNPEAPPPAPAAPAPKGKTKY